LEGEGGIVLGCYGDPLGKNPLILAILPTDSIERRRSSAISRRRITAGSPTSSIAPACFSTR